MPGTPATWELALDRWGSIDLQDALRPAARLAHKGFVVDATFRQQTADNAARFADFTSTRELYLPGGAPPEVGSVLRNPDLAQTYDLLGRRGTEFLYEGHLAEEIVATVTQPPVVPGSTRVVRPGLMRLPDLAEYDALLRDPTLIDYRGLTVAGMAPPSSGGSTVGEALNILENSDLGRWTGPRHCTATSRQAPSRSPTATDTSATPTSWTSHSRSCSRKSSPTSAPA